MYPEDARALDDRGKKVNPYLPAQQYGRRALTAPSQAFMAEVKIWQVIHPQRRLDRYSDAGLPRHLKGHGCHIPISYDSLVHV